MKIKVLNEKVVQRIKDGNGEVCGTISKPTKLSITYDVNEQIPLEDVFTLDGYGLVEIIDRHNPMTLIVNTL